jgi:cytochrome c biogenesis protein CcmG/thiol:disulfide interchange protein DsbE
VLLIALSGCSRGSHPNLVGHDAPDFVVQDSDRRVELKNLTGKIVVLNFWATWCPPCVEEMPSLGAMQAQLQNQVQVLAVSIDEDSAAYHDFLREHNIQLLTVRDPEQKSSSLYGTHGWPETYIIDRRGIVRRKFIGPVDWTRPEVIEYLKTL